MGVDEVDQVRSGGRGAGGAHAGFVLLVGCYRPAVTAARALARAGHKVVAAYDPNHRSAEGSGGVEWSRFVHRSVRVPTFEDDPDAYLARVAAEAARIGEPVAILPFHEPVVIHLARHRERLPGNAILVAPSTSVIERCIDKVQALAVATGAGLPMVPHQLVTSHAELIAAARQIGGIAIKPMAPQVRIGDRKAILCATPADAARELPDWPAGHERLLVQRLLRGRRVDAHFASRDGVLLGAVGAHALRTDAVDGTGFTVEGLTTPVPDDVREQLSALLAALRYTGVGLAQFLEDPDRGGHSFIELNPRPGAHYFVGERHGLHLANVAVDLAMGRPSGPIEVGGWDKRVRAVWTLGDLVGLRRAAGHGLLTRSQQVGWLWHAVRAAIRADVHATWSWRDPGPALRAWSGAFRLLATRHGPPPVTRRAGSQPAGRGAAPSAGSHPVVAGFVGELSEAKRLE